MKKILSILLVAALLFGLGTVSVMAQQPVVELQCEAQAEALNSNVDRPEPPSRSLPGWLWWVLAGVVLAAVSAVVAFFVLTS
ncbi:MAG: hypothetical protein FWB76_03905 [Oscillospiraceae bacterium]|nr:hypothetical protein [Oscillospiraceae bacterium]